MTKNIRFLYFSKYRYINIGKNSCVRRKIQEKNKIAKRLKTLLLEDIKPLSRPSGIVYYLDAIYENNKPTTRKLL